MTNKSKEGEFLIKTKPAAGKLIPQRDFLCICRYFGWFVLGFNSKLLKTHVAYELQRWNWDDRGFACAPGCRPRTPKWTSNAPSRPAMYTLRISAIVFSQLKHSSICFLFL